jgi:hypothetical protein
MNEFIATVWVEGEELEFYSEGKTERQAFDNFMEISGEFELYCEANEAQPGDTLGVNIYKVIHRQSPAWDHRLDGNGDPVIEEWRPFIVTEWLSAFPVIFDG